MLLRRRQNLQITFAGTNTNIWPGMRNVYRIWELSGNAPGDWQGGKWEGVGGEGG